MFTLLDQLTSNPREFIAYCKYFDSKSEELLDNWQLLISKMSVVFNQSLFYGLFRFFFLSYEKQTCLWLRVINLSAFHNSKIEPTAPEVHVNSSLKLFEFLFLFLVYRWFKAIQIYNKLYRIVCHLNRVPTTVNANPHFAITGFRQVA